MIQDLRRKAERKFNKSSLRERILISLGSIALTFMIWQVVFYDVILTSDQELAGRIKNFRSQLSSIEQQIDTMSVVVGRDPTAALTAQMNDLQKKSDLMNDKIVETTKDMVSPQQMNQVLRRVIQNSEGMTLVQMESLARKPVFEDKTIQEIQKEGVNTGNEGFQVFNHGLKVELLGTYFETMDFLKSIEKEELNLVWDIVDYEVVDYPKAKISITVHTLSLDKAWIGV